MHYVNGFDDEPRSRMSFSYEAELSDGEGNYQYTLPVIVNNRNGRMTICENRDVIHITVIKVPFQH